MNRVVKPQTLQTVIHDKRLGREYKHRKGSEERRIAIALGLPSYRGRVHGACGTTLKWLNGSCVYCCKYGKLEPIVRRAIWDILNQYGENCEDLIDELPEDAQLEIEDLSDL